MEIQCVPFVPCLQGVIKYFAVVKDDGATALAEVDSKGRVVERGLIAYIEPDGLKLIPFYDGSLPITTDIRTVKTQVKEY